MEYAIRLLTFQFRNSLNSRYVHVIGEFSLVIEFMDLSSQQNPSCYILFCAIYYYCDLRSNGRTQYLITSFSASVLEFYETLWNFTFGEKFRNVMAFYNGSDGTEQLYGLE